MKPIGWKVALTAAVSVVSAASLALYFWLKRHQNHRDEIARKEIAAHKADKRKRKAKRDNVNIGAIFGMDVGGTLTKIVYFERTAKSSPTTTLAQEQIEMLHERKYQEQQHQQEQLSAVGSGGQGTSDVTGGDTRSTVMNTKPDFSAQKLGNITRSVSADSYSDDAKISALSAQARIASSGLVKSVRGGEGGEDVPLETAVGATNAAVAGGSGMNGGGSSSLSRPLFVRRNSSESLAQLDQPDHMEALQQLYNFMDRNRGNSGMVVRDDALSLTSEALGGKLHFLHFETRNMVSAVKYLSSTAMAHLKHVTTIGCTGGGSHKYASVFEKELEITFNKHDELSSLMRGMLFAIVTFVDECYTYRSALETDGDDDEDPAVAAAVDGEKEPEETEEEGREAERVQKSDGEENNREVKAKKNPTNQALVERKVTEGVHETGLFYIAEGEEGGEEEVEEEGMGQYMMHRTHKPTTATTSSAAAVVVDNDGDDGDDVSTAKRGGRGIHRISSSSGVVGGDRGEEEDEPDAAGLDLDSLAQEDEGDLLDYSTPRDGPFVDNNINNKNNNNIIDKSSLVEREEPNVDEHGTDHESEKEEREEEEEKEEEEEEKGNAWQKDLKTHTRRVTLSYDSLYSFPYLVVNIGSGVSILKVNSPGDFERVSGTSLGGGTYWGLCRLLTRCETYEEVLDLAETGNAGKVDMLVRDIYGGDYEGQKKLPGSMVASSFGKLVMKENPRDGVKEQDLALALLMMITNNIGQVAYLNAQLHHCSKIYFVGSFLRHNPISCRRLAFAIDFWSSKKMEALFLTHEGYFGALGTFLESAFGQKEVDSMLRNLAEEVMRSYHQPSPSYPLPSSSQSSNAEDATTDTSIHTVCPGASHASTAGTAATIVDNRGAKNANAVVAGAGPALSGIREVSEMSAAEAKAKLEDTASSPYQGPRPSMPIPHPRGGADGDHVELRGHSALAFSSPDGVLPPTQTTVTAGGDASSIGSGREDKAEVVIGVDNRGREDTGADAEAGGDELLFYDDSQPCSSSSTARAEDISAAVSGDKVKARAKSFGSGMIVEQVRMRLDEYPTLKKLLNSVASVASVASIANPIIATDTTADTSDRDKHEKNAANLDVHVKSRSDSSSRGGGSGAGDDEGDDRDRHSPRATAAATAVTRGRSASLNKFPFPSTFVESSFSSSSSSSSSIPRGLSSSSKPLSFREDLLSSFTTKGADTTRETGTEGGGSRTRNVSSSSSKTISSFPLDSSPAGEEFLSDTSSTTSTSALESLLLFSEDARDPSAASLFFTAKSFAPCASSSSVKQQQRRSLSSSGSSGNRNHRAVGGISNNNSNNSKSLSKGELRNLKAEVDALGKKQKERVRSVSDDTSHRPSSHY